MSQATQPDLFGDSNQPEAAGTVPAQAVLRIASPAAVLSKSQKEFNRLVERLESLRDELARWKAADDRARAQQVAELVPLSARLGAAQREAVLWIDRYLSSPSAAEPREQRLTKPLRRKLVWMLLHLTRALLADGDDAEIEAAHDRHAQQSFRDDQREQADLAAAVLGSATGDEHLFDGPADSVEELLERASQRARAEADAAAAAAGADAPDWPGEPPASSPRRPSRADKARARDEQALKEASQSVREVYRRLASSLHPDRESDPVERDRKTALMAQVNQAYERNDLLGLLTVQLAIEQIDDEHLRSVSEQRLRHYIRVLKEQERSLKGEIELVSTPWHMMAAEAPRLPRQAAPENLARLVDEQAREMRSMIRQLGDDMALLQDTRTRKAFVTAFEVYDPDEELDPFEEMLFEEAVAEMMQATARGSGAGKAPGRAPKGKGKGKGKGRSSP